MGLRFAPGLPPWGRIGSQRVVQVAAVGDAVARCATLGRSQEVCKRSLFPVEGERCVVNSSSKGNLSMGENRLEKIDVGINRLCQQISAPLRG